MFPVGCLSSKLANDTLAFFFFFGSCQNPLINAQLSSLVSNSEMISLFSVVHVITVNHKTSTSRLSLNHV